MRFERTTAASALCHRVVLEDGVALIEVFRKKQN